MTIHLVNYVLGKVDIIIKVIYGFKNLRLALLLITFNLLLVKVYPRLRLLTVFWLTILAIFLSRLVLLYILIALTLFLFSIYLRKSQKIYNLLQVAQSFLLVSGIFALKYRNDLTALKLESNYTLLPCITYFRHN